MRRGVCLQEPIRREKPSSVVSYSNTSKRICPDRIVDSDLGLNLKFYDSDSFVITYLNEIVYISDNTTHPQIYMRLNKRGIRDGIDVRLWKNKKILTVWITKPLEEIISGLFQIKDKLLKSDYVYINKIHKLKDDYWSDSPKIDISDYKFVFDNEGHTCCYTFNELKEKYSEIIDSTKGKDIKQTPILHILSPLEKIKYQTEEQRHLSGW